MFCLKCGTELPMSAMFCPACGAKAPKPKGTRPAQRSNGTGSAYKRGKVWEAQIIIGYKDGVAVKRRKSGFHSKREALAWCVQCREGDFASAREVTLARLHEEWSRSYEHRVSASTMNCYEASFKHFAPLHARYLRTITAKELQDCLDDASIGPRARENMKTYIRLAWAYAMSAKYVLADITRTLYTPKAEGKQREPITDEELAVIRDAIGTEPYAEYIYALCYLGFRPGEMLALTRDALHVEDGIAYLVGGSKTEAGRDRRVPVPKQIAGIIQERAACEGTQWLFPRVTYYRDGSVRSYARMTDKYFRDAVFKPMMARLGIAAGKVPYCARHTYADKLKKAAGTDGDKAAIIGHSTYSFTQQRYQSRDLRDLQAVVDSIE